MPERDGVARSYHRNWQLCISHDVADETRQPRGLRARFGAWSGGWLISDPTSRMRVSCEGEAFERALGRRAEGKSDDPFDQRTGWPATTCRARLGKQPGLVRRFVVLRQRVRRHGLVARCLDARRDSFPGQGTE
jgi:hypothetical protein